MWGEKREKVVSSEIYPLGVTISISDNHFDWHMIVIELLKLLRSNPEKAFDWSRHWGRAIVIVNPKRIFSCCFSMRKCFDEKISAMVETLSTLDPVNFIDVSSNVGDFTILLNYNKPMSLEGALLQVERMIDEVVWCTYLSIRDKNKSVGMDTDSYRLALDEVWRRGIRIKYVAEEEIFQRKIEDFSLPVRVYGDVLKRGKLPQVIGAVVLPSDIQSTSDLYASHRATILKKIEQSHIAIPLFSSKSQENTITYEKSNICCAVTIGKSLHIGHLLLFTYAELVRRCMNSPKQLYIELDDAGDRIAGLVAALACEFGRNIEDILYSMHSNEYSSEIIRKAYSQRLTSGALYEQAKIRLQNPLNEALFSIIEEEYLLNLAKFGLTPVLLRDSKLRMKHACESFPMAVSKIDEGFKYIRYQKDKHSYLMVLEKNGFHTASAMRLAMMIELSQSKDESVIFVDSGSDVALASSVLDIFDNSKIKCIEGAAVGFDSFIASATNGQSIQLIYYYERIINRFPDVGVSQLKFGITFFLLTRYAVALGHRENPLSKAVKQDSSFYDYKDQESLIDDMLLALSESTLFLDNIKRIKSHLIDLKTFKSTVISGWSNTRVKVFREKLLNLKGIRKFDRIFPKSKPLGLPDPLRKIREWLHHKYLGIYSTKAIDVWIIESLLESNGDPVFFYEYFKKRNNINFPTKLKKLENSHCQYIDNLFSRGYNGDKIKEMMLEYLSGNWYLIKKRCIYYDLLVEISTVFSSIEYIDQCLHEAMLEAIDICINYLGVDCTTSSQHI